MPQQGANHSTSANTDRSLDDEVVTRLSSEDYDDEQYVARQQQRHQATNQDEQVQPPSVPTSSSDSFESDAAVASSDEACHHGNESTPLNHKGNGKVSIQHDGPDQVSISFSPHHQQQESRSNHSDYGTITDSNNDDDDDGKERKRLIESSSSSNNEATTETTTSQQQQQQHQWDLAGSSSSSSSMIVTEPQPPCILCIVRTFESLVMLTCILFWLTEVLLPLLMLLFMRHRRDWTLSPTSIVLIIYVGVLVIILFMVESRRRPQWILGWLTRSPLLQPHIYRGFWYSLVGVVGLTLLDEQFQKEQQNELITPNAANAVDVVDGYNYTNITFSDTITSPPSIEGSLSWSQISWTSWMFLQVLSSVLMVLVGWIYILAGLLFFACGDRVDRLRTRYAQDWTQYRQAQYNQRQYDRVQHQHQHRQQQHHQDQQRQKYQDTHVQSSNE